MDGTRADKDGMIKERYETWDGTGEERNKLQGRKEMRNEPGYK